MLKTSSRPANVCLELALKEPLGNVIVARRILLRHSDGYANDHFVDRTFCVTSFFLSFFYQTEVQLNVTREKLLASDLIHMIHTDRM